MQVEDSDNLMRATYAVFHFSHTSGSCAGGDKLKVCVSIQGTNTLVCNIAGMSATGVFPTSRSRSLLTNMGTGGKRFTIDMLLCRT